MKKASFCSRLNGTFGDSPETTKVAVKVQAKKKIHAKQVFFTSTMLDNSGIILVEEPCMISQMLADE